MMGELDDLPFGDDIEDGYYEPTEVACRHCGSTDVYWHKNREGRWVLYGFNSRKHQCNDRVVTEHRLDAFTEIEE